MRRTLTAMLLVLGTAMPVSAKALCPPGRFVMAVDGMPSLDGGELVLGHGDATIGGCVSVRADRFLAPSDAWLFAVRARWPRCARRMRLRARFDLTDAPFCGRLIGVVRAGGSRRVPFVAERVPECGNGLREPGEQCDEGGDAECCGADCRVKPGCAVACDDRFQCAADEVCARGCGGGACRARAELECGGWPVCDCSEQVTYRDRCAAWEAGAGVFYVGPCHRYCTPGKPDQCLDREFCSPGGDDQCQRWQTGTLRGICTGLPYRCDDKPDDPVCGCDGRTYRNRCELTASRMAPFHAGACF